MPSVGMCGEPKRPTQRAVAVVVEFAVDSAVAVEFCWNHQYPRVEAETPTLTALAVAFACNRPHLTRTHPP